MQFEEIFTDNQKLFDKQLIKTQLKQYINVKILANNKIKQIGKVIKANELLTHLTSIDIFIIINETIFDKLTSEQKEMIIEEFVSDINFDWKKFEVTLVKPHRKKLSYDKFEDLGESLKALYDS